MVKLFTVPIGRTISYSCNVYLLLSKSGIYRVYIILIFDSKQDCGYSLEPLSFFLLLPSVRENHHKPKSLSITVFCKGAIYLLLDSVK